MDRVLIVAWSADGLRALSGSEDRTVRVWDLETRRAISQTVRRSGLPRRSGASIPSDMLAASASGLGPHISPASAKREIARAAKARGVTRPESVEFTARFAEGRDPEFVGQPWADVLLLNVALDERRPANR